MGLSVREAKQRELAAIKALAESEVLYQWYSLLGALLRDRQEHGKVRLDFSEAWIHVDSPSISRYYASIGDEHYPGPEAVMVRTIVFVQGLIGDQLEELGLTPTFRVVSNGIDYSRRIYFVTRTRKRVSRPGH